MKLLTIETTCDETAAAVVTDELEVLSSVVASQDHCTSGSAAWCRKSPRARTSSGFCP